MTQPAPFDPMFMDNSERDLQAIANFTQELRERFPNEPISVVEVGCWAGLSTLFWASGVDHVYAVDHWLGSKSDLVGEFARKIGQRQAFETFCTNMGDKLHTVVHPCIGPSELWAKTWPKAFRPHAAYIDADHGFKSVCNDIELWWPIVRPGGLFAGHDYNLFDGVNQAVDRFGKDGLAGQSIWYRWKPAA